MTPRDRIMEALTARRWRVTATPGALIGVNDRGLWSWPVRRIMVTFTGAGEPVAAYIAVTWWRMRFANLWSPWSRLESAILAFIAGEH